MKSYSEMIKLKDYNERLEYLYIGDEIGHRTFGSARWMNQRLYKSQEWKQVRDFVILRDNGCDLGVEGCDLSSNRILVHHINPITEEDVILRRPCVFDPDNLISISHKAHNYVHFGIKMENTLIERSPHDTCPWRR